MSTAAALVALALTTWAQLAGAAPLSHSVNIPPGAQVKLTGATAMLTGGNGETGTFSCYCKNGKGACALSRGTSSIVCDTASGSGACTGECVISTTTTGVKGAAAAARATGGSNMSKAP
jgi:hypothetical protein